MPGYQATVADTPAPIAVIGVGFRLPGGATDLEKLEALLNNGHSGWGEVPGDRWSRDAFYNPTPEAKESLVSRSGYFLHQDISKFDARFFQIPATEAEAMDPQQRILLQTTYEALENAGIPLESVRGSNTSVFASVFATDYDRMGYKDLGQINKSHLTGTGDAILSNRISYVFDLKGASITLNTACSGSLVCLHQACQNLRLGESDMAIVGGANLLIHPDQSVNMSTIGMVNPDGRCYVFDSRGSGYARGEGVASVILKPLDQAVKDGNPIHAVIVNSGVNQDGKTAGISVPSGDAQVTLMRSVYDGVGLSPGQTPYVETHGTGTQVGDKVEISSISKVFCENTSRETGLYAGSVKSNLGHLEATSGIAGLLKSIVVLKTGLIPPHLDLVHPKSSLKLEERNIKVAKELTPLFRDESPRRVSVNSFGYGGTNCHVILESGTQPSAPHVASRITNGTTTNGTKTNGTKTNGTKTLAPIAAESYRMLDSRLAQLFVLSAASEKSLEQSARNLYDWVSAHGSDTSRFADLAYTLAMRRSLLPWRRVIVSSTFEELKQKLDEKHSKPSATKATPPKPLAFVFTGQGAQWPRMGSELLNYSLRFNQSVSKSDELLRDLGSGWSLLEELSRDEKTSRLGRAEVAQPATTALQIALVDLLHSIGITPQSVVGHSSGEIGAAYAAGALSHEAAIEIAYHRGVCSGLAKQVNSTPGSMLAVGLGEEQVLPYLLQVEDGSATVACVNSPQSTTISGDEAAIDQLKAALDKDQIFARKLNVDTAYHSHHMKKIVGKYLKSLGQINTRIPKSNVGFYSTVTGSRKRNGFGPEYWAQNLVSQVKFVDGLAGIRDAFKPLMGGDSPCTLIEIGPHSALAGPTKQTFSTDAEFRHRYLSVLTRKANAVDTSLALIGRLVGFGYHVDLEKVISLSGPIQNPRVVSDLQPYAWDESSFWRESRLSAAHRFRDFPYHDLCGLLDPTSTLHEPRWRHHLSLDAVPWMRDHVIDEDIVFPGSGYVCMALEAMKQLVKMRKIPGTIQNFLLNSVVLSKAISVPLQEENWEIEIQLAMSPSPKGDRWKVFRIYSYNEREETWDEHCSGLIAVEMASKMDEVEGAREETFAYEAYFRALHDIQQATSEAIDGRDFYYDLKSTGNHYGPSFAPIDEVMIDDRKAWMEFVVPEHKQNMPDHFMQPHLIHPTTLDAIHQLGPVLFKRNCSKSPVVVAKMDMVISANIDSSPGTETTVAATLSPQNASAATSDTWLFQRTSNGELVPVMKTQVTLRAYGRARRSDVKLPYSNRMAYKMAWEIDEAFITNAKFQDILDNIKCSPVSKGVANGATALPSDEESDKIAEYFERASSIYLSRSLPKIRRIGKQAAMPHLEKLRAWIERYCASPQCHSLINGLSVEDEMRNIKAAEASSVMGQMLTRIGKVIPQILAGEIDPLALMLQDNLLSDVYAHGLAESNYLQMLEYLRILTFKKPYMKFLEVGAGTGGLTLSLFESLTKDDGVWMDRYDYTDISSGFFEQARDKLKHWLDYVDFRTLDIALDPLAQGFAKEQYDVVVAVNVLHATKNMDITLANVRKLMKPGGKLILIEPTRSTVTFNLIFGILPGWWASEDGRSDSPHLSPDQWNQVLRRNSFSGVDIVSHNSKTSNSYSSFIVSEAILPSISMPEQPSLKIKLLVGHECAFTNRVKSELVTAFEAEDYQVGIDQFVGLVTDPNMTYVVLDIAESALLLNEDQETFESLKNLFTAGVNVLWVALQETGSKASTSSKGMIHGTARVVRRENSGAGKFITFNVDDIGPRAVSADLAQNIVSVAKKAFGQSMASGQPVEYEYSYGNRAVSIPRLQTDTKFLNWVDRRMGSTTGLERVAYHQAARPLRLEVATPGLLGSLRFVDDDSAANTLKPWEIQLSARAHGVNFKDVFIALGQMLPGVRMVGEVAGIVAAVGKDMKDRYHIGDKVAGFASEAFASAPRINGDLAHRLPDSMPFTTGAAIPAIYATAYYCLVSVAHLKKGQSILIHAASGGVGQAAIQLAQCIGAEIFATVGSTAKRNLLLERYGLPESHVFSTRSLAFKKGVLRLTKQRGVDVVLNSLSGEMLGEGLECVAKLGMFIEIGKTDIYNGNHINMAIFNKSISFAAVDLVTLIEKHPDKIHTMLGEIIKLFEKGVLYAPSPENHFPIQNIEDAFRMIATRKHLGKIVLVAEEDAMVMATSPRPVRMRLTKDGTYIVAGGLGDLGKRVGVFLSSLGAGNIVLLSRRTLGEDNKKQLEEQINEAGSRLHVLKCDITKEDDMSAVVLYCKKLPPVKGIIHSGMVYKDAPLAQMQLDDFIAPLPPKVYGTINLDKAFASSELDFFIMLSSVAAVVGSVCQANYAAGNAFQDAFSHAQASHPNARYISINVGAIGGSELGNVMVEKKTYLTHGIVFMTFDEFFKIIEYAMCPQAREDRCEQPILGFVRQSMVEAGDTVCLSNPLFSQLPYQRHDRLSCQTTNKAAIEQAVASATSLSDAEALIARGIAAKCAAFLDMDVGDILMEQSMADMGLDSLVSIELKNWLVRTFQITLQMSEFAGAASILALAWTVASRSKLISDDTRSKSESKAPPSQPAPVQKREVLHQYQCCKAVTTLPRFPLVGLEEAFQYLLDNISRFADTRSERDTLHREVREFIAPGGVGYDVYQQLVTRAQDPDLDSWFGDLYTQVLYLQRRHSIALWGNFVGTHQDSDIPHTQAERAAVISMAAFTFLKDIESDALEPEFFGMRPICTYQWKYLFNCVREPRVGCDVMRKYAGSYHFAVLRQGRLFKVQMLDDGGQDVSYEKLKTIFKAIIDSGNKERSWAGILTTDGRDSWAVKRNELLAISPANAEYLHTIETAAFVVCLDESSPQTREQRVVGAHLGDSFNRWHDKSAQFIVFKNGCSAQIFEHSALEGGSVIRLAERIQQAIHEHQPQKTMSTVRRTNGTTGSALDEYTITTNAAIEKHIVQLRKTYKTTTSTQKYLHHTTPLLGKAISDRGSDDSQPRISAKAAVDLAIQLASRLHFGHNPASWEPVATQHFHRGRPDIIQVVSDAVLRFCDAALAPDVPVAKKRAALVVAAREWEDKVQRASQGRGYLRVLELLCQMDPDGGEAPALLANETVRRAFPGLVLQTLNNGEVADVAMMLPKPEALWMSYSIRDESVSLSIVGSTGKAEHFQTCFDKAAEIVKAIVGGYEKENY